METYLTHAFQVVVSCSSSGHLRSLGLLGDSQSLLLLVKDQMLAELALSLVESLHLDLHEPEAPTDVREVDASLGAEHDFVLSSGQHHHGNVARNMLQLFREDHCPICDPDELDPAIHLSANNVSFVKLFHAEDVSVEIHDQATLEGLSI